MPRNQDRGEFIGFACNIMRPTIEQASHRRGGMAMINVVQFEPQWNTFMRIDKHLLLLTLMFLIIWATSTFHV